MGIFFLRYEKMITTQPDKDLETVQKKRGRKPIVSNIVFDLPKDHLYTVSQAMPLKPYIKRTPVA